MFGGEFPFSVKGSIPVTNNDDEYCELNMVNAKTKREVFMDRMVPSEFLVHYTFGAGTRKYYFIAKCKYGRIFHSREVTIGESRSIIEYYKNRTPLDFGVFTEVLLDSEK